MSSYHGVLKFERIAGLWSGGGKGRESRDGELAGSNPGGAIGTDNRNGTRDRNRRNNWTTIMCQ